MYRVVFIDDETWVIRAVNKTFQWEQSGFELISAMTSSVEALEMILQEKPDVVFTDIRMPVLSGIELMRKVREKGLNTEFVVVSGFSEFTYAQEALQLGAFDYCLKPLQTDKINALLDKLYAHLENKKTSRSSELFETLLEDKDNITERLRQLGMQGRNPYYQGLILQTSNKDSQAKVPAVLKDSDPEIDSLEIPLGKNKLFYFVNTKGDIGGLLESADFHETSIGLSRLSDVPGTIDKLYSESDAALSSYFIYNENRVYRYTKKNITVINELIERILSFHNQEHQDDLKNILLEIPQAFRTNKLHIEDVTYLWNQMVAYVSKTFELDTADTTFDFMDYNQIVSAFGDIQAFSENLLNDLIYLVDNKSNNEDNNETLNGNFNKLLKYVQENFEMQLLLKELSKKYFINQNYCSILFKKYLGCTFTDYLNRLRMEKSKALLESIEYSIVEIAQKVGYNDYFYYIKVFKKYYGTTPSKYRKKKFAAS